MKQRLLLPLVVFLTMFGAWSLGREIVETWRGESSMMFPLRLLCAALFTVVAILGFRLIEAKKKDGD